MKAKLTFDLPEDRYEYDMAVNGSKWRNVAWDMYQYLRQMTKYVADDTHEEFLKAMYQCKDEFIQIMGENGVDLDE